MSEKMDLNTTGQTLEPTADLGRRRITALTALALLGGATITLSSCGGSGAPTAPAATPPPATPPPPPASTCPTDAACGQVSVDPLHSAVITAAQLAAGGALVLDIRGAAAHNHTVTLTADEVVAIRARTRVVKTSSTTSDHEHQVTFN